MVRRRVIYSGRVQGVGFRATAQWVASGRPVSGWVRNQEDGNVLLEVQGEESAVEDYLAVLRGRMGRNIKREDASISAVVEGERGFSVRR
jgi:acylphosphatase